MVTSVQKWGNSLALRIPKAFASEAHIDVDSLVDISVIDEQIIIARIRKPRFTLESLLDGVTTENIHDEFDTGPVVGMESI